MNKHNAYRLAHQLAHEHKEAVGVIEAGMAHFIVEPKIEQLRVLPDKLVAIFHPNYTLLNATYDRATGEWSIT